VDIVDVCTFFGGFFFQFFVSTLAKILGSVPFKYVFQKGWDLRKNHASNQLKIIEISECRGGQNQSL